MTVELDTAIRAALAARNLLRSEFNRGEGPRGSAGHAEADKPSHSGADWR